MNRPDHVPALGTARRINTLRAAGHTDTALGRAYHPRPVSRQCVHQWRTATAVTVDTANAWRALYDRLSAVEGTCTNTRIHARRAGHHPPEAWVGVDMDDPDARPHVLERDRGRVA